MAGACRGRDNELSAPHWQGGSRSAPAHGQALHEEGAGHEGGEVRTDSKALREDLGQSLPWGRGRRTADCR